MHKMECFVKIVNGLKHSILDVCQSFQDATEINDQYTD